MFGVRTFYSLVIAWFVLSGCASVNPAPTRPPGLSGQIRNQIGVMAIRTPSTPHVILTTNLDTKGNAAGKTAALVAGSRWFEDSRKVAAQTGHPYAEALVYAVGIVVVASGAIYGAAAADTNEAIIEGNEMIHQVLDFAPQRLAYALKSELREGVPVRYEFVGEADNQALLRRGFDTVLDLEMLQLTSLPDDTKMHITFKLTNKASLTRLSDNHTLVRRHYNAVLPSKAVSTWAARDGQLLLNALDLEYAKLAAELIDHFFARPSIRVQGLAPVTKHHFKTEPLNATRPRLEWSAIDARQKIATGNLSYEVSVYKSKKNVTSILTRSLFLNLEAPLDACTKYYWKVRAHYNDFDESRSSNWSPEYMFKSACER